MNSLNSNNIVWNTLSVNEAFGKFMDAILAETLQAGEANPYSGLVAISVRTNHCLFGDKSDLM